jgi:hypothetical protein
LDFHKQRKLARENLTNVTEDNLNTESNEDIMSKEDIMQKELSEVAPDKPKVSDEKEVNVE